MEDSVIGCNGGKCWLLFVEAGSRTCPPNLAVLIPYSSGQVLEHLVDFHSQPSRAVLIPYSSGQVLEHESVGKEGNPVKS